MEVWGNGGGVGLPEEYKSRVFGDSETAPEEEEMDDSEGEEGGPGPP